MTEKDNFETLGDAYAKYPQSTLVMRKQFVDEKDARIADLQKTNATIANNAVIEQKMAESCSNLINKRCNFCSLLKKLSFENKVLENKLKAANSEYRALRDACPQEILEKLQVDYSESKWYA